MKSLDELIKTLDLYLVKKAPALPKNVKETLVQYSPWITLIVLVLSLPALFAVFSLGSMFTYSIFRPVLGPGYYISLIFLLITVILQGMSIPGLMAKSKKGWNFVFYAVLVNAVYSLLAGNWAVLIIGTLVSLYFVFQVREYYK
jgi:hypothetical protein